MEIIESVVAKCNEFVWGVPMLVLLFGTHIFLTIRLRFIQRHTLKAIKLSVTPDAGSEGNISQFGALATALAATIGTGNIIGVSTAIAIGGPGAVLWTWLTGLFGIATKYGESLLSVKYRVKKENGQVVGGPMYAIEKGLKLKWLAVMFAVFTVLATFGAGCTVQSNAITSVMHNTFNVPPAVTGLIVTIATGAVILGGIKAIAGVCEKLVPFMSLFYILGCITILVINREAVWPAFQLIISSAFSPKAAAGGFVGSTLMTACRFGVARGLFSNESGLGTAPIAAATAQTKNPVRQALVSMTGTFWDTVVVCAMTGLVIVSSVLSAPGAFEGIKDDAYVQVAFAQLPGIGKYILAVALAVFAFTTILGWSFYGERCIEYLFGRKSIIVYRTVFLVVLFIGSVISLGLIWGFADLMNGLMAFPNLVALLCLSKVIVSETKYYLWEDNLDKSIHERESEHTEEMEEDFVAGEVVV